MTSDTHIYTVYKITNKINNKYYIGIHKEEPNEALRKYMGSGTAIKKAIEDEGVENFHKEILFRYDNREEMIAKEAELVTPQMINENDNYNLQTGGSHPIMSEAARRRHSEAMSGENNPCFGRTGEKNPMFGRTGEKSPRYRKKHSEATRQKQSEAKSGENHPNAKKANIYDYKTDRLIAEGVVIREYARNNGYSQGNLSATARADRTLPSSARNKHHTKNIYAQYL